MGSGSEVFEIADLGRLGRRALRGIVRTARAGSGDTLTSRINAHLDEADSELAVVSDSWPVYDQVNVQLGLDDWLVEREHELVGGQLSASGIWTGRTGGPDHRTPDAR
jgi:hypothetical protein